MAYNKGSYSGVKNVEKSLVDPKKILAPTLYVKFGLMKEWQNINEESTLDIFVKSLRVYTQQSLAKCVGGHKKTLSQK